MENPITKSPVKLIPQLGSAIAGVTKYGVILGLDANLGTAFTTKKSALELTNTNFQQGKTDSKNSHAAKKAALKASRTFAMQVRELAKSSLGASYSQFWDAFGFTGSLRIPHRVNPMLVMLGTMGAHLTAHPEFGSTDANLTGARAGVLADNLSNAKTAASEQKSTLQQLSETRAQVAGEAQVLLRQLFSVLVFKLSPLDARWVEFGFNKPGALPTPGAPLGVTAVLIGTNAISIKWPATARAEYYRIWMRVIGQSPEFGSMGTSSDLSVLLENLPANSQVEVAISAVNNGGESAMSTILTVATL